MGTCLLLPFLFDFLRLLPMCGLYALGGGHLTIELWEAVTTGDRGTTWRLGKEEDHPQAWRR